MKNIGPGDLSQRITFQEQVRVADSAGGSTPTWPDIATNPTVWAAARPLTGRESRAADRMNAIATYLFTVRHRTDIDETMRIVWNGVTYNITFVPRLASREMYMAIEATRGVPT